MRKVIAAILLGMIPFYICSCVSTSIDTDTGQTQAVIYPEATAFDDHDAMRELRKENPVADDFYKAVNDFSYESAQVLLKNKTDNFNYSPLSLYYALALAGTGADGETKQQILELLGVSSAKELSVQCGNLYRLLYTDNKISKLKIANSLWLDDDADFKKTFVSDAAEYFYASAFPIDFSDKDSGKVMAQWISENTNGTIMPDLEIDPKQILSIINTIYFYDEWINRFDEGSTREDTFHADGRDVKADFMNQTFASAQFVKGDNYTRSSLSLKGNRQMVFILPDKGVSVSDLLDSKDSVKKLFEDREGCSGEVVWKIPKFKFDTKCELTGALKSLGVENAFKPDADFSGITDDMAYISDVIQQTHIAIDENGVEASAFTIIQYFGSARPAGRAEMILDRPFIFGITAANDTLLFVGICQDPSL